MVGGVQHASPENPDALALDIKKGNDFQPRFLITRGQARQSRAAQFFVAAAKGGRCKFLGNERRRLRLSRKTHELSKETPLGKELVFHNVEH